MKLPGLGIAKGMWLTAKHMFESYTKKDGIATELYPEEKVPITENGRIFPFLVFDGNDPEAGMRCVACKTCEKECPPQCIYIVQDRDEKGKPQKRPKVFNIDISVCMSCQICVEVCPFDAIYMDQVYELSNYDRFESLLLKKRELLKSNAYFHSIHPTDAAEVDRRRDAERAAKQAKEAKA